MRPRGSDAVRSLTTLRIRPQDPRLKTEKERNFRGAKGDISNLSPIPKTARYWNFRGAKGDITSPSPRPKIQDPNPMLFDLHDITKTYGKVTALRRLSVAVPTGAVGLLGPNGAGKTTLIRTLLGLITIDSGFGQVLGLDLKKRRMEIRQAVGFVAEDECLFPGVFGVEFVAYAGELCGMSRGDAMQRAHEVLNYLGLGEARYRPVGSYSSGMKQRIKLAAALVHDPRLLILDEPTNGMDPAGRQEMLELARDLAHSKGMSLLFSSHLLPDVEFVCDHVLCSARADCSRKGRFRCSKNRTIAATRCGSRPTLRLSQAVWPRPAVR